MSELLTELKTMVVREIGRMKSDANILLVLLGGPLVYTVIFGLVYMNYKVYDIPIAVVDADHSTLSRMVIRDLEAQESLTLTRVLDDDSAVPDLMMNEECWAAVVIPQGFERSVSRGDPANVTMLTNTSNIVIGNYAQRGLQSVLATVGTGSGIERLERKGVRPSVAVETVAPVVLQTRTLFNPGSNYANFVLPLLLILLLHQVIALSGAMSWAKEFEEGSATAALRGWVPLIGKSVPYAAASAFWLLISVIGTHAWVGIPFLAHPFVLLVFGVFFAVDVVLIGALVGTLVKNKVGAVQMLFFLSMPLLLISGGNWPLQSMPVPLRWLAMILPSTHLMDAYRRMALEGAGFSTLAPSFCWLSALTLALTWVARRVTDRALPAI